MHTAWLSGQLITIGAHVPKDYPKSAADLLPKPKEVAAKAMNAQQWAATLSNLLGKPILAPVTEKNEGDIDG